VAGSPSRRRQRHEDPPRQPRAGFRNDRVTGIRRAQRAAEPQRCAVNPSISLSAPATNPVQAQIQDDYAAQLSAEQRQMLQHNPSGTTRLEIIIGHALNGFSPR
jgi:hypothetical protein